LTIAVRRGDDLPRDRGTAGEGVGMFTRHGATDIYYDTFGDARDRPLLLVCGLGQQCVGWPEGLIDAFVAAGFFVMRYDNRDVGLSTKTDASDAYTLSDMARDGIAVLDALGVDRAHVWGASMGGMIAQTMAIEHPDRVASLTSVMSNTGDPTLLANIAPEMMELLAKTPPSEREAYLDDCIVGARAFCGPHIDEADERRRAAAAYDRCFYPDGSAKQVDAVAASGDRTEALRSVAVPTTVVHGRVDPLLVVAGGEATAAAVKDARLVVLDEMGHDLPAVYWPTYVAELVDLVARADAR
jgi:pimeloyl-ACP methyl ester carboxylesterase